jgi:hypothetical protein
MSVNILTKPLLTASVGLLLLATACTKNLAETTIPEPPTFTPTTGPDQVFYGLTDDGKLNRYNAKSPGTVENSMTISGLASGEKLLSIDFRPATGQLYGLGSTSRLYVINLKDASAKALGTAAFTPALNAQLANIDFNPTVDRIRLVTTAGQNLRLHPETGAVAAVDGNINGGSAPAAITSIAYTNSKAGAATTELYDIDIASAMLYKQNPPNDGTLAAVGPLGVLFAGKGGFDINPNNSVALATFTVTEKTRLYSINLTNGAATYINEIAANLVDIAIPTDPVVYAVDDMNNLLILEPTGTTAAISKAITGLGAGETVQGIDMRPANGQLYAFTTNNNGAGKLYAINLSSGAATAVGAGFMVNAAATHWGFDFNPTVDRIRLISNMGENYRLNPNDGTIAATDGMINPGNPMLTGAAYTNNFNGATTTVLYVMNSSKLFRQDPPNNGTLVEIANLGNMVDAGNGFDIGGNSDIAYVAGGTGTSTNIYRINLTTGAFTMTRSLNTRLRGFAVALGF